MILQYFTLMRKLVKLQCVIIQDFFFVKLQRSFNRILSCNDFFMTQYLFLFFLFYTDKNNYLLFMVPICVEAHLISYFYFNSSIDFVRSQFGKMQLWIVEHFHLHKKVPVLMNHNIWKNCMLWFITTGTFLWRWKCTTIQSCILLKWLFTKSIL